MTEQEWLASTDPEAMLRVVTPPVSDRKLRLWVEACRERGSIDPAKYTGNLGRTGDLLQAIQYWSEGHTDPLPHSVRAALLRDIAGNPWRPIPQLRGYQRVDCKVCGFLTPDEAGLVTHSKGCYMLSEDGGGGEPADEVVMAWITPTAISLAYAAYDERAGRRREECMGRGGLDWYPEDDPGNSRMEGPIWSKCPDCGGTGRIDDGTLDPVRLAVLADALEEAGCDSEDLLAHLRSPAPHVRGCWAVDFVLGLD